TTGCQLAPRRTAVSKRGIRPEEPATRKLTQAGRLKYRSMSKWCMRSVQTAKSCWSRRLQTRSRSSWRRKAAQDSTATSFRIRGTDVDVSADASPTTGAAVYDSVSYQGHSGWFKVGGTSLSSPIVAAIYALAGNAASTIDGSYPYSHKTGLFDVTSGSNGACGG